MAEELVLTDPIVTPPKVTDTYRIVELTMSREIVVPSTATTPNRPGAVYIAVRDNHDGRSVFAYAGDDAIDMIKWINTANFTTHSLNKRLLQKLSNDGHLPGTVTGTPEPPTHADL